MRWYQKMIIGLCEIFDGLVSIVTFGQYRVNAAFNMTAHFELSKYEEQVMTVKYRVNLMESERGWGQGYWHEDYDTLEEAKERIRDVNSKNTAPTAPDWYMIADERVETVNA